MIDNRITLILIVLIALFSVLTFIVYAFPSLLFSALNIHSAAAGNGKNQAVFDAQNNQSISNFIAQYGFGNDSYVRQLYPDNSTNVLIFDCNYGIVPQLLPLLSTVQYNSTIISAYENSTRLEFVHTLCEANLTTENCSQNIQDLYANAIANQNTLNLSVSSVFIPLQQEVNYTYGLLSNVSYFGLPALYFPEYSSLKADYRIVNNVSNNSIDMLKAVLNIRPLPMFEFLLNNSVQKSAGQITPPGQFQLEQYPQIKSCNASTNIFNFITSPAMLNSSAYTYMYSWLAPKVTNVCVYTSSNTCNAQEMKTYNFSFAV